MSYIGFDFIWLLSVLLYSIEINQREAELISDQGNPRDAFLTKRVQMCVALAITLKSASSKFGK